MDNPRKGRCEEQHFLNLPGFNAGAFIRAYVQDTTGKGLEEGHAGRHYNPHPRIDLEISDCSHHLHLEFEIDSAEDRANSFHKIDTLIGALTAFREAMAEEARLYKARERALTASTQAEESAAPRAQRHATRVEQERLGRAADAAMRMRMRAVPAEAARANGGGR